MHHAIFAFIGTIAGVAGFVLGTLKDQWMLATLSLSIAVMCYAITYLFVLSDLRYLQKDDPAEDGARR